MKIEAKKDKLNLNTIQVTRAPKRPRKESAGELLSEPEKASREKRKSKPQKIKEPKVRTPKFKVPKIKLPGIKLPSLKMPNFSLPKIKTPQFKGKKSAYIIAILITVPVLAAALWRR
jgi:hypothetical protein